MGMKETTINCLPSCKYLCIYGRLVRFLILPILICAEVINYMVHPGGEFIEQVLKCIRFIRNSFRLRNIHCIFKNRVTTYQILLLL